MILSGMAPECLGELVGEAWTNVGVRIVALLSHCKRWKIRDVRIVEDSKLREQTGEKE